ncbi:zinc-dependent peptidase [Flavobacterium silvaticum]|uniref:Zinc-dependent peptidase n=1 Tax=Flavobacterium silvaticum TaxID=1852020 RepID=A0A972FKQ9_9FLAO|nr:zinc-dependent peptidase [Flavobacterium silvaticum]NMH27543.1 zinc-dependent peptidase [Flavobacterium silvaticum]
MEILAIVFVLLVFLAFVLFFFSIIILKLETVYAGFFDRPFYVHFYPVKKRLALSDQSFLHEHSAFYRRLDDNRKQYFEHRIARFLDNYEFIGKEGFEVTDEVRIRVAHAYIMMSFGWRNYLTKVFERIVIFPEVYESSATGNLHKGEFNPRMKAVVFSWADFVSGEDASNDNLNLGIHEFAHVMHFHGTRSADISALVFAKLYKECMREVMHPNNNRALRESGYLREYAYTDQFEFLAVVLEHFFETPDEFQRRFPQLFTSISKMLNYRN